jgi:transcriptional regulator with XRE-family HTH domain
MSPEQEYVAGEVRAELARQKKRHGELASLLGITRQSLSFKIRGIYAFSTDDLVKIARWLDVPVAKFLPDTVDVA